MALRAKGNTLRDIGTSFIVLASTYVAFATASATYDKACSVTPLTAFNLDKILSCGLNSDAYAVWIPPKGCPYCKLDSIDRGIANNLVCYDVNRAQCSRIPYIYYPAQGQAYLERDLGNGTKTRSIILDTDNCKYFVQIKCYPDGSVWRYVTYKNSWTQSEIEAFKKKIQKENSLKFLSCLTFNCAKGAP
ncbi:uncharacterized protein LOC144144122 [Haemaphysalis longicornis]